MFDRVTSKKWLHFFRAHLCTLAIAVSFNSTWRVPRDALRYGGVTYGITHTVAMVLVALPITLLQLAVGQLCQQDVVGIWRAVPFFKGVGYLRLLISAFGSIYTVIYLALITNHFFDTMSNPTPYWDCTEVDTTSDPFEDGEDIFNSTLCFNVTHMAPVTEEPEQFLSTALIAAALWIVCPFILYNPVRFMKRIFYVLGPIVLISFLVIISCIGDSIERFIDSSYWEYFLTPYIWHAAIVQALWSSQVAGGYLVSASDTVYSGINVQWTAYLLIGANILFSWLGSLFWFGIATPDYEDTTTVAVLAHIYLMAKAKDLDTVWPLLMLVTLFLSGVISLMSLLYPLYERFRVTVGQSWHVVSIANSLLGAAAALAVLAGGLPILNLLEDVTVPLLISVVTVLEVSVFITIYGFKLLVEDIEFLAGKKLERHWVVGWWLAPIIILSFTIWWVVDIFNNEEEWSDGTWEAPTLIATIVLACIIFFVFAAISVGRQVQYDVFEKLKASFKPSRHWGPRDPITHYYWLSRREDVDSRYLPRSVYQRQLGQFSGRSNVMTVSNTSVEPSEVNVEVKKRANSDDWLYTVFRKRYLERVYSDYFLECNQRRAKSLDWSILSSSALRKLHVQAVDNNRNPSESIQLENIGKDRKSVSFTN